MNNNNYNNNNSQFNNNNINSSNNITNNQPVPPQNFTYVPQQSNVMPSASSNQTIQQSQIQNNNFVQQTSYYSSNDDKYYTDKTRGFIAFILLVVSVILIFYFKNLWGYLLALITFIFTLFNRKYRDSLLKLTKWLSLLLLIFCGFTVFTAYRYAKNMKKLNEEYRIKDAQNCETKFVEEAKIYVNDLAQTPTKITTFNKWDFTLDRGCNYDWYVVYNPYNQTYKAYVSNKYYTTEGFEEDKAIQITKRSLNE